MKGLSCENIVSSLFQTNLNNNLWIQYAESSGFSSLKETAMIQEQSLPSITSCKPNIDPYTHNIVFHYTPIWLWFEVWPEVVPKTILSIVIQLPSSNGNKTYHLNTVIYYGMNHFTCSFLDSNNNIWFHDGQKNEGKPLFLKNLSLVQMSDLTEFNGRIASIYIYTTILINL